jgi:predicted nucleic acid-binding protein
VNKYFIDTNLIIHYFDYGYDYSIQIKRNDRKDKKEAFLKAKSKIEPILENDDSEIFINRLVYLEALRKETDKKKFNYLKNVLSNFTVIDIYPEIYEKAVNFSRYCYANGITIKGRCAAIDFVHFITAKHYEFELVANDKDMETLEIHYSGWLDSKAKML